MLYVLKAKRIQWGYSKLKPKCPEKFYVEKSSFVKRIFLQVFFRSEQKNSFRRFDGTFIGMVAETALCVWWSFWRDFSELFSDCLSFETRNVRRICQDAFYVLRRALCGKLLFQTFVSLSSLFGLWANFSDFRRKKIDRNGGTAFSLSRGKFRHFLSLKFFCLHTSSYWLTKLDFWKRTFWKHFPNGFLRPACPEVPFEETFFWEIDFASDFFSTVSQNFPEGRVLALISSHVCQTIVLRVYRNIWQISFRRKSYEQFRTFIEKSSEFFKKKLFR